MGFQHMTRERARQIQASGGRETGRRYPDRVTVDTEQAKINGRKGARVRDRNRRRINRETGR